MNNVINNKDTNDVDLESYDVAKCFDKMEYQNTAIDLFNAGVQDDRFVAIANSNKKCDVAIKTPWGKTTKRTTLEKIEMQGTVLPGLKCSISIDTLGKECLENQHQIYKNCVNVTKCAVAAISPRSSSHSFLSPALPLLAHLTNNSRACHTLVLKL